MNERPRLRPQARVMDHVLETAGALVLAATFGWIDCATIRTALTAAGRTDAADGLGPFMIPAFLAVMALVVVSFIVASIRKPSREAGAR